MSELANSHIVRLCVERMLARMEDAEAELGRLDAAAGDGDHGAGMVRGLRAAHSAIAAMDPDAPAGSLLVEAGSAFADEAGGASGALVGALFSATGQALGSGPCTATHVHAALSAGLEMVCRMGNAAPGDKTLVDTLDPFVRALGEGAAAGLSLTQAWRAALPAAEAGVRSTAEMVARRGRSARLGERSLGHLDPGAVSMLYLLEAAAAVLA